MIRMKGISAEETGPNIFYMIEEDNLHTNNSVL